MTAPPAAQEKGTRCYLRQSIREPAQTKGIAGRLVGPPSATQASGERGLQQGDDEEYRRRLLDREPKGSGAVTQAWKVAPSLGWGRGRMTRRRRENLIILPILAVLAASTAVQSPTAGGL